MYWTPCTIRGRPISAMRISVFPEVSQTGHQHRVVPDQLWRFCANSERPRRSKTESVLQQFCRLHTTHTYRYIIWSYLLLYYLDILFTYTIYILIYMAQEFEALQAEIMIPRMIYSFAESRVSSCDNMSPHNSHSSTNSIDIANQSYRYVSTLIFWW